MLIKSIKVLLWLCACWSDTIWSVVLWYFKVFFTARHTFLSTNQYKSLTGSDACSMPGSEALWWRCYPWGLHELAQPLDLSGDNRHSWARVLEYERGGKSRELSCKNLKTAEKTTMGYTSLNYVIESPDAQILEENVGYACADPATLAHQSWNFCIPTCVHDCEFRFANTTGQGNEPFVFQFLSAVMNSSWHQLNLEDTCQNCKCHKLLVTPSLRRLLSFIKTRCRARDLVSIYS